MLSSLSLLAVLLLAAPSSPCQPRIISCLPSSSTKLECFCSGTPQPSSIQNILEEVSDNLQETTSELTVRSCAENHHSVRLDLGQKQDSDDLEVQVNNFPLHRGTTSINIRQSKKSCYRAAIYSTSITPFSWIQTAKGCS